MPRSTATAALALALIATALAQTTTTAPAAKPAAAAAAPPPPVRLCVYDRAATPAACADAVASALGAGFTCVTAPSASACAAAVADGRADLVRVGADDTSAAAKKSGLLPVAAEEYGKGEATAYWSVAVVRASMCPSTPGGKLTAADLKGARLCSTGYRKGAGWTAPVGTLLASGDLPRGRAPRGVAGDAAAVASFFGPVCAPRKTSSGPRVSGSSGALWPEGLCDGCLSPAAQAALPPSSDGKPRAFCEENAGPGGGSDAYAGYGGAIDCLLSAPEGSGVVMFNKADAKANDGTALPDLAAGKDLRLWCPLTSSCAPLADYRNCNLGRVRAHALMARPGWGATPAGAAAVAALAEAGPTGLQEGAEGAAAPFYSKDAKAVLDCEAGGARCGSDFSNWFGLTRAYASMEGTRAKVGLSPGAVAGIVIGGLAGLALLAFAGVALARGGRGRGRGFGHDNAAKAFATGSAA